MMKLKSLIALPVISLSIQCHAIDSDFESDEECFQDNRSVYNAPLPSDNTYSFTYPSTSDEDSRFEVKFVDIVPGQLRIQYFPTFDDQPSTSDEDSLAYCKSYIGQLTFVREFLTGKRDSSYVGMEFNEQTANTRLELDGSTSIWQCIWGGRIKDGQYGFLTVDNVCSSAIGPDDFAEWPEKLPVQPIIEHIDILLSKASLGYPPLVYTDYFYSGTAMLCERLTPNFRLKYVSKYRHNLDRQKDAYKDVYPNALTALSATLKDNLPFALPKGTQLQYCPAVSQNIQGEAEWHDVAALRDGLVKFNWNGLFTQEIDTQKLTETIVSRAHEHQAFIEAQENRHKKWVLNLEITRFNKSKLRSYYNR